jgi:hypothetical protein
MLIHLDQESSSNALGEQNQDIMLSQCANSDCRKPFLRLREGKLFLVETDRVHRSGEAAVPPFVRARKQRRVVEHFWLCDDCAPHWTLAYDAERGIELIPLRRATGDLSAHAAHSGAA